MASSTTMPRSISMPASRGEAGLGADADGHDDDVGAVDGAVLEQHGLDAVLAEDRLGLGLAVDLDAAALEVLLQQVAGRGVELALHQVAHDVQDHDLHAAQAQAGGGFEPEQAAADHHRLGAGEGGGVEHLLDVVDVAEGDDAFEVLARQRQDEGDGAGGDQQLVVGGLAGLGDDDAARRGRSSSPARRSGSSTSFAAYQSSSWVTISS